ncbi:MAG: hypothetical protein ACOZBL_00475 [Patescibacteria group bacterium]
MKRLNWKIILSNINEARLELEELEKEIKSTKKPTDVKLEISLRHAYHHLNFAWNIRYEKSKKYSKVTDSNFTKWGKFPRGMDTLEIE